MGKNIQALKSRLWEGILPLSDQRWCEKGLDRWENFHIACQHLTAVVTVFEYLNHPAVVTRLRDAFNRIWDHWTKWEEVINEKRARQGQEPVSITKRWTEFIGAHYEMMTSRAHHWVISRVETLRRPLVEALHAHRQAVEFGPPDDRVWALTDRLHMLIEIASVADFTITIPMDNYRGYTKPPGPLIPVSLKQRSQEYSQRLKDLSRRAMLNRIFSGHGSPQSEFTTPQSSHRAYLEQVECQEQVRREVRGEALDPLPAEPWVMDKLILMEKMTNPPISGYGFVIYRLTHQQTDAEWDRFVQKLESHVADWGGQKESDKLKPHLKLYWLDGMALDIPDGDIQAARKHFQQYDLKSIDAQAQLIEEAFLAVDEASIASYTTPAYGAASDLVLAGDFTGFVLAVDADYDPTEGYDRPHESPGYSGHMQILGSLVWSDLYASYSSMHAHLPELWPLALEHPNQVYVGPTVPLQVLSWRIQNGLRNILLRQVIDYIQAKVSPSSETPVNPTTRPGSSSSSSSLPEPARAALDAAIREMSMRSFPQWLRRNNRPREAVLAEEALNTPPGHEPDWERIRRRLAAVDETGGSRTGETGENEENNSDDNNNPCVPQ